MGYAFVAVIVLLTLGLAYLSFKTWRIYQVILVVLVFWGSLTFVYLAARTLATHSAWRNLANKLTASLEQEQRAIARVVEGEEVPGGASTPGIGDLKHQLHTIAIERGSAWYNVTPGAMQPDGSVEVTVESPSPHSIVAPTVMFVFEAAKIEDGGSYLGQFNVTAAAPNSKAVRLAPVVAPSKEELDRLQRSKGPWDLYAMMPVDQPAVLAGMSDQQRTAMLGAELADEYKTASRQPKDYALLFREHSKDRAILLNDIQTTERNIARTEAALAEAEAGIKAAEQLKVALQADRKKFFEERDIVIAYHGQIQQQLTAVRADLAQKLATNERLAQQLSQHQLKAAEEIDRRTGPAAAVDISAGAASR